LLADLVVPIAYSVGGTGYATALWQYKSAAADAASRKSARAALRLILLAFLHDHGRCLWSCAGVAAPTHVAVVPSGRGCGGTHPLRSLAGSYLTLPWADLVTRPGEPALGRDLQVGRFRAAGRLTGATVLLLDDTWTSGASAQSAAAALKLAGARSVVTVILGRHLNPSDPKLNSFIAALAAYPFRQDACAVHGIVGQFAAA
jgi:phosphoribosylpyrophosphate synthetase